MRTVAICDRVSRRTEVNPRLLDVVVLECDILEHGLRRGDLGAVVEILGSETFAVEFVAASGRTQALLTLRRSDVRRVRDDDLVAVRPGAASR